MPVEMLHPFKISASGGVSTTPSPDKQIAQRVRTLIATDPGERRVNVEYGVPTNGMLFENQNDLTRGVLEDQIRAKLDTYEPGVFIERLDVGAGVDDYGAVDVELQYVRREAATTATGIARSTNTAVIRVGGTVSEIVRG